MPASLREQYVEVQALASRQVCRGVAARTAREGGTAVRGGQAEEAGGGRGPGDPLPLLLLPLLLLLLPSSPSSPPPPPPPPLPLPLLLLAHEVAKRGGVGPRTQRSRRKVGGALCSGAYREAHGRCNVPHGWEDEDGFALGTGCGLEGEASGTRTAGLFEADGGARGGARARSAITIVDQDSPCQPRRRRRAPRHHRRIRARRVRTSAPIVAAGQLNAAGVAHVCLRELKA